MRLEVDSFSTLTHFKTEGKTKTYVDSVHEIFFIRENIRNDSSFKNRSVIKNGSPKSESVKILIKFLL